MVTEEHLKAQRVQTEHKNSIEKIRKDCKHTLSSHAFASIYLWQKSMGLSLELKENFFSVRCGINGDNSWFFPCGNEDAMYNFICNHIDKKSFSLGYLRESDVKWLEKKFPDKWQFNHLEECDEYICDISEYILMEGSKFSEIRRKIRKLDKEYKLTAEIITDTNIADAMFVVSRWNEVFHNISEQNLTDENVAETALSERKFLDISGIVLYADGKPVSVFAGFPLSDDTVDVLIGKCVPDAPKGTVYYGLKEYLKLCASEYKYCNHEEDLGIDGIRQMKTSLCPISKTMIWEAVLKC